MAALWREEGWRGWYKAPAATLLKVTTQIAVRFMLFEEISRALSAAGARLGAGTDAAVGDNVWMWGAMAAATVCGGAAACAWSAAKRRVAKRVRLLPRNRPRGGASANNVFFDNPLFEGAPVAQRKRRV